MELFPNIHFGSEFSSGWAGVRGGVHSLEVCLRYFHHSRRYVLRTGGPPPLAKTLRQKLFVTCHLSKPSSDLRSLTDNALAHQNIKVAAPNGIERFIDTCSVPESLPTH